MKISKQEQREAKQLFRCCLAQGQLQEERASQVVQALVSRKPRGYMGILSHFQRLLRLEIARRTATVESAVPLPEALRDRIQENLNQRFGQGLRFQFKETPALLGGLRIQVGSHVFDGSIKARLAALQDSF